MCYIDEPDVFSQREVVARKRHQCVECDRGIKPGDTYEQSRGLWDGKWSSFKTCARCARLRSKVQGLMLDAWGDGCIAFGDLKEQIRELRQ